LVSVQRFAANQQINAIVYELYSLTEEEIKVVGGGVGYFFNKEKNPLTMTAWGNIVQTNVSTSEILP